MWIKKPHKELARMALSQKLQEELREPFGRVMQAPDAIRRLSDSRPEFLAAVGDETILNLLANGIRPDLGVYDLRCKRQPITDDDAKIIVDASQGASVVQNPAGTITAHLKAAINERLLEGGGWIRVEGEDDLAALALMASMPDGAVLLYGQPGEGMVWVEVTPAIRNRAIDLVISVKAESQP